MFKKKEKEEEKSQVGLLDKLQSSQTGFYGILSVDNVLSFQDLDLLSGAGWELVSHFKPYGEKWNYVFRRQKSFGESSEKAFSVIFPDVKSHDIVASSNEELSRKYDELITSLVKIEPKMLNKH